MAGVSGIIFLIVGIVGAVACFLGLIFSWFIFAKQRKKLLKFMEEL